MKLKKFENFENDDVSDEEVIEDFDETDKIYDTKTQIENFLGENELEYDVLVDEEHGEIVVELEKSDECFNSENLETASKGKNVTGFMGNFSTLEEMYEQLGYIEFIIENIVEMGLTFNRCYLEDNSIYLDFFI